MPGRMELKNKRVLVVGLARTGVATALFCAGRGAAVPGTASRNQAEVGEEITAKLRAANVNLELGGHQEQTFLQQDLIIPSPGVPADAPLLQGARAKGVTIWSEIELAYRFRQGKLIGVTGSYGKSTSSLLDQHHLWTASFPTIPSGHTWTAPISSAERMWNGTSSRIRTSTLQLELL